MRIGLVTEILRKMDLDANINGLVAGMGIDEARQILDMPNRQALLAELMNGATAKEAAEAIIKSQPVAAEEETVADKEAEVSQRAAIYLLAAHYSIDLVDPAMEIETAREVLGSARTGEIVELVTLSAGQLGYTSLPELTVLKKDSDKAERCRANAARRVWAHHWQSQKQAAAAAPATT